MLEKDAAPRSDLALRKITILGFCYLIIAGLVVVFIHKKPLLSVFASDTPAVRQILIGLAISAFVGAVQFLLLRYWTWWSKLQADIADKNPGLFRTSVLTIVLISLIVGISEEILFRAAIQPIAGIWVASVLFTVVHLNFDFSAIKKFDLPFILISVGMIFVVSLMMGVLFAQFGLLTSIAAHFIYDAIVLSAYRNALSTVK